jgi:acyl-CoA synthetase (AMP-forming)/AMP-acid ligase II
MNVVEPILFQCRLNPLATAVCVPGSHYGPISYGMLERLTLNVARNAVRSGITPHSLVGIYVNDTVLHAALALGLMYMGAATVSLRGPGPIPGISPDAVLTNTRGQVFDGRKVLNVDESWLDGGGAAGQAPVLHDDENAICRITLTSGSTGVPKGIACSHKEWTARAALRAYSKGSRFSHCSRFFCDLGFGTSPGFGYALSLLNRGGTVYFLGSDPADILQAIDLYQIQGMATSPYGLGEYLKFFEADSAFQVTFDHIICQGAMLSRELSQRVRARLCQNLYSSYGSSETTTVAFGPASVLERVPGAVGYIQPRVRVEVLDGAGKLLPPLRNGTLRIRTDHMTTGYVGDPETTKALFRDGYFYSGDIGHLTPDGLLVITGREKTALNIGGDTVHPELVEQVLMAFGGVGEAAVFALNNELGIAELHSLIVATGPLNEAALQAHCAGRLAPSCVPVRYTVVKSLPRGGQGKLDRTQLPAFVAAATANRGATPGV